VRGYSIRSQLNALILGVGLLAFVVIADRLYRDYYYIHHDVVKDHLQITQGAAQAGENFLQNSRAMLLNRQITRPILVLAQAAQKAAAGDLSVRASPNGSLEIAAVATEFSDAMGHYVGYGSMVRAFLMKMARRWHWKA
jgi:methyl-accepting chemotaxis protein